MIRNYCSPTGAEIVGTLERLTGQATITGIDDATGEPEWEGYTEVFWDDQATVKRDGKIVFLDTNGAEWKFEQLTVNLGA